MINSKNLTLSYNTIESDNRIESEAGSGVLVVNAESVWLEDLFISGYKHGIEVVNSKEITLSLNTMSNNTIENADGPGVLVKNAENVVLEELFISEGRRGIEVIKSKNLTLSDNTIDNVLEAGIILFDSHDSTLVENTITYPEEKPEGNYFGIAASGGSNITISDSEITGKGEKDKSEEAPKGAAILYDDVDGIHENSVVRNTISHIYYGIYTQNMIKVNFDMISNTCKESVEEKTKTEDGDGIFDLYPDVSGCVTISEVMYDPEVAEDDEGEYVELYNTCSSPISVLGIIMQMNYVNVEGESRKKLETIGQGDCGECKIQPNGYFLLRRTEEEGNPDFVDCTFPFNLVNEDSATETMLSLLHPGGWPFQKFSYIQQGEDGNGKPIIDCKSDSNADCESGYICGYSLELKAKNLDSSNSDNWHCASKDLATGANKKGDPTKDHGTPKEPNTGW